MMIRTNEKHFDSSGEVNLRAEKVKVLGVKVDALGGKAGVDLLPGIPGGFVAFMAKKYGNDWVVGRATENLKARYTTVISRGEYEKAVAEYEKQTGRRHY